jgi:hypothetical protein
MEQIIFTWERESKENLQKSLERAKYYKSKGELHKALDEYLDALEFYGEYRMYYENAAKVRNMDAGGTGDVIFSGQAIVLFDLYNLLASIYLCICEIDYDSTNIPCIGEKICLVVAELAKYEKDFTVEQIESYDDATSTAVLVSNYVKRGQETLANIKKVKPEKTENEQLRRIRVALKKISSTKSCPIELEKTDGCFIATAAYMTPSHPDLDTFRDFRDRQLLTHPLGKIIVSIYYQVSPSIASYIEKKPRLRQFIREKLAILAQWLRK